MIIEVHGLVDTKAQMVKVILMDALMEKSVTEDIILEIYPTDAERISRHSRGKEVSYIRCAKENSNAGEMNPEYIAKIKEIARNWNLQFFS